MQSVQFPDAKSFFLIKIFLPNYVKHRQIGVNVKILRVKKRNYLLVRVHFNQSALTGESVGENTNDHCSLHETTTPDLLVVCL